jgi:hypothetical protein
VTEQPHALLRAALLDQGWREGDVVTAISDGDPALPALVRSATGSPVERKRCARAVEAGCHSSSSFSDGYCGGALPTALSTFG